MLTQGRFTALRKVAPNSLPMQRLAESAPALRKALIRLDRETLLVETVADIFGLARSLVLVWIRKGWIRGLGKIASGGVNGHGTRRIPMARGNKSVPLDSVLEFLTHLEELRPYLSKLRKGESGNRESMLVKVKRAQAKGIGVGLEIGDFAALIGVPHAAALLAYRRGYLKCERAALTTVVVTESPAKIKRPAGRSRKIAHRKTTARSSARDRSANGASSA